MGQAEGLTVKLEGGHKFIFFKDTGIVAMEQDAPPSNVFFTDLESGINRGPYTSFLRGELNFDIALASGQSLRLGGIWSDQQGNHHEETPVYFWWETAVRYSEDGQIQVSHGRIGVCHLVNGRPEPCGTFVGDIDRSYSETMPQILLGQTAGNRTTWYGLQGFTGRLDETTSSMVLSDIFTPNRMRTELGADATGLMLVLQQERTLPSGALLSLGLGLGGYRMKAFSLSYLEGERNPNATEYLDVTGTRAQLSAGLEFPLSDRLSLGGTVRADLWSDQPRVAQDVTAACIERLVCHGYVPTKRNFDLTSDPFSSVSVGLSLSLRL